MMIETYAGRHEPRDFRKEATSSPTKMTISAHLRIVRGHFITQLEMLDSFTNLDYDPGCLVTGHDWRFGSEIAVVNVQVGAADSAGLDWVSLSVGEYFTARAWRVDSGRWLCVGS